MCVSVCVLYQRIVCSLHKCVCVSVCVCLCVCAQKVLVVIFTSQYEELPYYVHTHTQGLMKVVYTHFTSFDISRNGPYIG